MSIIYDKYRNHGHVIVKLYDKTLYFITMERNREGVLLIKSHRGAVLNLKKLSRNFSFLYDLLQVYCMRTPPLNVKYSRKVMALDLLQG